jgi:hypothetical protein
LNDKKGEEGDWGRRKWKGGFNHGKVSLDEVVYWDAGCTAVAAFFF